MDGGGGGWGPKRGNFRGSGGCYRGLFPGGLSDHEIGELLINNSSVEKAVSYLLLPVFQKWGTIHVVSSVRYRLYIIWLIIS